MKIRVQNRILRRLVIVNFVLALFLCAGQGGCEKDSKLSQEKSRQATADSVAAVDSNAGDIENVTDKNDVAPEPNWPRPRFAEHSKKRRQMVMHIRRAYGFQDDAVLDAMQHIPRHEFVTGSMARLWDTDSPLPIGYGQTISQPYIVAFMTSLLELDPNDKVLEIGTGSGYQAAVLTEFTPHVYTIEIVEPLGRDAKERLARLGYSTVKTRIGDGYKGWPEAAPFDAIIVTCSPESIPKPLIEQLKVGGRMIIPVGRAGIQELVLVTKNDDGSLTRKSVLPVRFVPMTGEAEKR